MILSLSLLCAMAMPVAPKPGISLGQGAGSPTLTVDFDQPTVAVSPHLYGIFFEEINWAGDGGLYAEMVRNRGFTEEAAHWIAPPNVLKVQGRVAIVQGSKQTKLINPGFAGMGLRTGHDYRLNLRLRGRGSAVTAYLTEGNRVVSNRVRWTLSSNWQEQQAALKATKTSKTASLVIEIPAGGRVELDWVSLFPADAVSGIFRKDLFQTLQKLKPAFLRFPGGCWVEGDTMETAYRWKKTIGPAKNRGAMYNLWKYQSTNGLGYHEYLQLCRDLKAVPMFVANCGMSHRDVVPMDQMDEYVQDILDAIEYANGPVTSKWGALRAQHGSPKPFGLKYLEIGNENGGPAYEERYGHLPGDQGALSGDHDDRERVGRLSAEIPDRGAGRALLLRPGILLDASESVRQL